MPTSIWVINIESTVQKNVVVKACSVDSSVVDPKDVEVKISPDIEMPTSIWVINIKSTMPENVVVKAGSVDFSVVDPKDVEVKISVVPPVLVAGNDEAFIKTILTVL